ncbi:alpha/beta hydrolase [Pontiellaceae bacterium B12219]|nr:alpha/beta hydrolase [Pontiellaceae bacterium B12219]
MKRLLKLMPLCVLLQGCSYFRSNSEQPNWQAFNRQQIEEEIQPLEPDVSFIPSEAIQKYFDYYDLSVPDAAHYFGTVESQNETLAVHLFIPGHARSSLFLLHGYFDHTGTLSSFIREAVKQKYAVVVWDLPGHGLSSGARTDTGAFALCAAQFQDIAERAATVLPQPFNLIAHSTGCSIALEYLYANEGNIPFKHLVFLAPLIRHEHWAWGKFGYTIARPFTNTVRRRDKKNSSDEAYLAFVKQDPLHSSMLSFDYLSDLYGWEKTTHDFPEWSGSLCIIQGDNDDIVDWDYNLDFLSKKMPHAEIHLIPGARHQLLNESDSFREQVFHAVFSAINQP